MLKIQEIREIIRLVDQSSIDEFKYEFEGLKLSMKKKTNEVTTVQAVSTPVQAPVTTTVVESVPTPVQEQVTTQVQQPVVEEKPAAQPKVEETANLHKITSPMVGTFYQAPNPEADPYVKVGSKITKDSIVCIVEAMKLFNEIEAEVDGEIVEVLVENGQLVEFGQPLFLVKVD